MATADHLVHAPASRNEPWDCEFQPSKNYKINPVNVVFNVFTNEEDLGNGKFPLYVYPDLGTLVRDFNFMCPIIADGLLKSSCYKQLR